MVTSLKLQILLLMCCLLCILQVDSDIERSLSRKKRYVVFPEGSSFSIALCMTIHTLTPDDIFTEGLNWGISYDLPNESKPVLEPLLELRKDKFKINKKINKIPMENKNNYYKYGNWNNNGKYYLLSSNKKYKKSDYHYLQRRHRRDLYSKLEVVMNAVCRRRLEI